MNSESTLTNEVRLDWRHWLFGVNWNTETIFGQQMRFTAIHFGPLSWIITKQL